MDLTNYSHRRFNPLTGEWLLVSPHRTKRPWQGKVEKVPEMHSQAYEPTCYLCPGNARIGSDTNPAYTDTFVFTNDFSALLPDAPAESLAEKGLFVARSERGICKVVCFSPQHNLTFALMEPAAIEKVVTVWIDEYRKLGAVDYINYVQIFENRGDIMGCSNPHPHGQIWANETIPQLPAQEDSNQQAYRELHGSCMLCDYLALELEKKERIVLENNSFVAVVPFWAVWPFETMILAKEHHKDITTLSGSEQADLAAIIHQIGVRYDNLFSCSFPYSMGLHQQPTNGNPNDGWHFHLHYYPPLLRSATVKKFMVGYEMLAMPQRDITAEQSAERLRSCDDIHFTKRLG